MPRDWHPTIAFVGRRGSRRPAATSVHGVSTANLAGRTLAELIRGETTSRTELPPVNHRSPDWEPEPFRWVGVRYTQWALGRIDAQAERTQRQASGPSIAMWLARH